MAHGSTPLRSLRPIFSGDDVRGRWVLVVLEELCVFLAGQDVVQRFEVSILGDEVAGLFFPGLQNLFLL